jgi:hypothetical protein
LNVDVPDAGVSVANGQRVFVGGWAVAPGASNSGISSVDLFLDSPQGTTNQIGSAKLGIDRPDVVTAFGHPEWRASGYNFDWVPRNLAAGPHTIYVVAHSTGGQAMTQAVQISGCGCGFVGSVTNPGVRKLGNDAWELDTGGPGVFIERPFDNIPGGN